MILSILVEPFIVKMDIIRYYSFPNFKEMKLCDQK